MQTDSSYETIPYLSKFFIQTHPEWLAVIGTLFGMNLPSIEKCRVLELGCGNGSNLMAHAFSLPDSEFVGVDLAQTHIDEGNQFIADLDLTNIKLYQMDVMKMSVKDFGKFDYIIAHGLFSWVPDFVRDRVLQIYDEMLAPNGIGYISYNTYPGSHLRQLAQKPMRFIAKNFSDPVEKVKKSVSFLQFLTQETNETEVLQPVLQNGLDAILKKQIPDIFHDDLAETNRSFYFYEFVEQLEKYNLQFLAETEVYKMSTESFSAQAKSFLDSLKDLIEREQYIDFFCSRFFRRSLVCKSEINLNHQPNLNILDKFSLVSSIRPAGKNPNFINREVEKFVGYEERGFEIDHPLTKMFLFLLGQKWAKAVQFTELLEEAKQTLDKKGFKTDNWEKEIDITRQILLQLCLTTDFIYLHLYQPPAATKVPLKPEINKLARWQLGLGSNVYTLFNQNFNAADPVLKKLLELMDGTRNNSDLIKSLKEFLKSKGETVVHKEVEDKSQHFR